MPVALPAPVYPTKGKGGIRLLLQAEKQISVRRRDGHAVRAVGGGDGISAGRPTAAGQIAVLLQSVAAGVRPRDDHAVAGAGDDQIGQAGALHHGNNAPESAGE
jgi:hypothetical protein